MTVLKSIVVCLALANIGYFLWLHGIEQSQAVPPPAILGKTLKLASEVPAPRPPAVTGASSPSAGTEDGAAAMPATVRHCVSVGPFKEVSEAAHAASTLRGSGYDPRQRVVDGDVWAGVWVYLPLPATHPESDQILAKLKAAGIDDSLLMPGPGDGSVISLGLFTEQKRAQARVAQMQALGLAAGVADRKRTGNLYWIDVDLRASDALNPADLQGEAGHINRLEVKACPAPAAPDSPGGGVMSEATRAATDTGATNSGGGRNTFLKVAGVCGALVGYGCLAAFMYLISLQIYRWFRQGEWIHFGVSEGIRLGLMRCGVSDTGTGRLASLVHWLDAPVDWLGLHKVLEVLPASLALFLLSMLGNSILIYCRDRIGEPKGS